MPRFPSNPWGFFGFLSEHGEEGRLKVVGHHPYSTHPTKTKSKKAREKDPNTSNTSNTFKHCILSCLHLSSVSLPSHFRLTSVSLPSHFTLFANLPNLPMLSAILCWASHHLLKFVACHPLFQTPLHFCIVTSIHLTRRFSFQHTRTLVRLLHLISRIIQISNSMLPKLPKPIFTNSYRHLPTFTSCIYILHFHHVHHVS